VYKKDFDTLTERLTSSCKVQTAAMKHGIENEGNAVLEYATHKNVNIKPCGFVLQGQIVEFWCLHCFSILLSTVYRHLYYGL
jgi:hypothetical protein